MRRSMKAARCVVRRREGVCGFRGVDADCCVMETTEKALGWVRRREPDIPGRCEPIEASHSGLAESEMSEQTVPWAL